MSQIDATFWAEVERQLPSFLQKCRWFGAKSRQIRKVSVLETIPLSEAAEKCVLVLCGVDYLEGAPQLYLLPLRWAYNELAAEIEQDSPNAIVVRLGAREKGNWSAVYDATISEKFGSELLDLVVSEHSLSGTAGSLKATLTNRFAKFEPRLRQAPLLPRLLKGEQSNSSLLYGNALILKLFRRLEEGVSPDVEIGRFLTERTSFRNTPAVLGVMEYLRPGREPVTVVNLQEFVPNEGDAWRVLLDRLAGFCHRVVTGVSADDIREFTDLAELLGRRTMELHLALASDRSDPAFAPEHFTKEFQSGLHRGLQAYTTKALQALAGAIDTFPAPVQPRARQLLAASNEINDCFEPLLGHTINAMRTRTHGDYHLGQVLYTGDDFQIIDFEGEPARSLAERRQKLPALRDVAGMLRSFHYAAHVAHSSAKASGESSKRLENKLGWWHTAVCDAYLKGYYALSDQAYFLPDNEAGRKALLDVYLMEKALYELMYEINNRPDWVGVPLSGILEILEAKK